MRRIALPYWRITPYNTRIVPCLHHTGARMTSKQISRRHFLHLLGYSGVALLSACAASDITPTSLPAINVSGANTIPKGVPDVEVA